MNRYNFFPSLIFPTFQPILTERLFRVGRAESGWLPPFGLRFYRATGFGCGTATGPGLATGGTLMVELAAFLLMAVGPT